MRAFVTGSTGFVGRYLVDLLEAGSHDVVCGTRAQFNGSQPLDLQGVDVVFHLAAQSFVPNAIADPIATYETNVIGTARLVRAVVSHTEKFGERPRLIFASSADVYGRFMCDALPLHEATCTNPRNPYAASKAAAESIVIAEHNSFGLDVVVGRTFNAIGPGQKPHFAIASFAAQLARITRGAAHKIEVGNLEAERDFLDVRDVAAAYIALATSGVAGEIYNVCSGVPRSIGSLLDELLTIVGLDVEVVADANLMRPSETPIMFGVNEKIHAATGWRPLIPLAITLRDLLDAS